MAQTLSEIADEWQEETKEAADDWKSETKEATGPCEGLKEIEGIKTCNINDDYHDGVSNVSSSDFKNAVSGKKSKFKRNFKEGLKG